MQLNKEKLDQMVEAVKSEAHKQLNGDEYFLWDETTEKVIRTALTPFAMEMTDEEIMNEAEKRSSNCLLQSGFMMGANFVKHGK